MPSIKDCLKSRADKGILIYGCDTETYKDGVHRGLKSIQVSNATEDHYFTAEHWEHDDITIRNEISEKFVLWADSLEKTTILAWFNLNFDLSQFVHYLVCDSGFEYVERDEMLYGNLQKGQLNILEANNKTYKVELRNSKGNVVYFLDILNFLTDASLNSACKEWIGKKKVELPTKKFPKSPASELEKEYAINDARLTCELFQKLMESEVIEGHKFATIAGRTIGHYKQYLKDNFNLSFTEWCYGTKDKEIVAIFNERNEQIIRNSNRGGYCYAFHKGIFRNCHHIDARSMYPSQMYKDYIPWGEILDEPPNEKHTVLHFITGSFKLKDKKVPYFQFRKKSQCQRYRYINLYNPGDMVADCILDGSYMLWDDELALIKDLYDYHIEDDKQYYIRMRPNTVLKGYVEYLYRGKMENKGTKRQYFKILLNALYGKFLTRPDGDIVSYKDKTRRNIPTDGKTLYYLPLGSWIAMSGRVCLCRAMSSIDYDDLLYCDTDSIIFKGDKYPDVKIGKWLGEWGIENERFDAHIIGPKTYQELNFGAIPSIPYNPLITKCAGLSRDILPTIRFGDLKEGNVYNVLKARRDPETWAISLEEQCHEVKPRLFTFRMGKI